MELAKKNIRVLDVAVPLGTYTGWSLRAGRPAGDSAEAFGQFIAFPLTAKERQQKGDPRASIEERYPSKDFFLNLLEVAAAEMVEKRFLLKEDARTAIDDMARRGCALIDKAQAAAAETVLETD